MSAPDQQPTLRNASLETFIHVLGHNGTGDDLRCELIREAARRLRALAAATEEKEKADAEDVTGNGPFWRWFTAIWPEPKGSPQQRSNWAFKRDMAHAGWCAAESKLTELERENRELRERAGLVAKLDSVLQQDPFRLTIKWDNYQDSGVYIYDGEGKQVGHSKEFGEEGDGDPEGKTLRAAIASIKLRKP